MVKSGDLRGEFEAEIKMRSPSGKVSPSTLSEKFILKGDEHGANWICNVVVPVREPGLFWFDVYWAGEFLTSVPLRLLLGETPVAVEKATA